MTAENGWLPPGSDAPRSLYFRRRILRWAVPVDDQPHEIGGGEVLHVAARELDAVEVWTLEDELGPSGEQQPTRPPRQAQVFGTGHVLPFLADVPVWDLHLGTALIGSLVWHLFEVPA